MQKKKRILNRTILKQLSLLCLIIAMAAIYKPVKAQNTHPSIGGYNVYYGHLHNHSDASDEVYSTPSSQYLYAKNTAQLDFFGLANHDHDDNFTLAKWNIIKSTADLYNQNGVFTTFYGFEWSSTYLYGHIAVINTADYCYSKSSIHTEAPIVSNFNDLMIWLSNRSNGVAFLNHPGAFAPQVAGSNYEFSNGTANGHFKSAPSNQIVGMELWNKTNYFDNYYDNQNKLGFNTTDNKGYYDEALARGWKIGAMGSLDNHAQTWSLGSNQARMAILANNLTRADLLAAIQAKRFYSTEDANLALSFKIGGQEMGSSITTPGSKSVNVIVSDGNSNDTFFKIILHKGSFSTDPNINTPNITHQYTWTSTSIIPNQACSTSVEAVAGDYYYVEVIQDDGNRAISSPIWITGNLPPTCTITTPLSGSEFNAPASITLNAYAADPDNTITQVEFYMDNQTTPIATVNNSPYSYTLNNVAAGTYNITAKAISDNNISTLSSPISITIYPQGTIQKEISIMYNIDDVEEKSGILVNGSNDTELGYDGNNAQTVGLRFRNLGIPQGADIISAKIQFTSDDNNISTDPTSLVIKGHNSGNSLEFSSSNIVSTRILTDAGVQWNNIPQWNTTSKAGEDELTPELKSIVQEIVNRTDFNTSSAISFVITGTGCRNAEEFYDLPNKAPKLIIYYSPNTANTPPSCSISSPATGASFNKNDNVVIEAQVNNATSISKVEFYNGSVLLGEDISSPYSFTWQSVNSGFYNIKAKAYYNTTEILTSANVAISVCESMSKRIIADIDDVELIVSSNYFYTTSSDIELADEIDGTAVNPQKIGLRYTELGIPQGAIIKEAYIQFTCKYASTIGNNASVTIRGHASDNSPLFSTNTDFNSRLNSLTTQSVAWNDIPQWSAGEATLAQKTPDLKGVVQEIVNRSGFNASSAISFIITGSGTRNAYSFFGNANFAPNLIIKYVPNPTSSNKSIQAWMYPGYTDNIATINAESEFNDGRTIDVIKPQYLALNDDGFLEDIHEIASSLEETVNAYSSANVDFLFNNQNPVLAGNFNGYITISGSGSKLYNLLSNQQKIDDFVNYIKDYLSNTGQFSGSNSHPYITNFKGIELDLESPTDGWSYPTTNSNYDKLKILINQLGNVLKNQMTPSRELIVTLPSGLNFDWFATNANYNYLCIMAYDNGTIGGPLAPNSWVEGIIDDVIADVGISNINKIIIGMPSYGYHHNASDVFIQDCKQKSANTLGYNIYTNPRDPNSFERYFENNTENSINNKWYYQDAIGMSEKVEFIRSKGIKHVSVWSLGGNTWFNKMDDYYKLYATSVTSNSGWTNPENALTNDNTITKPTAINDFVVFNVNSITNQTPASLKGLEVFVLCHSSIDNNIASKIKVEISNDNGLTWKTAPTDSYIEIYSHHDVIKLIGSDNTNWGISVLQQSSLQVKLTYLSGPIPSINAISVKPHFNYKELNVKLFLEGFYNSTTEQMNQVMNETGPQFNTGICDKITLQIVEQNAPYNVAFTAQDVDISTDGEIKVYNIPNYISGNYYIVAKHRNHLETWSGMPVSFNNYSTTYNFTDGLTKALGSNQKQFGTGQCALYVGDVNQDGAVDSNDMGAMDNAIYNLVTGYDVTDLNGDGGTDSNDSGFVDNNSFNLVSKICP